MDRPTSGRLKRTRKPFIRIVKREDGSTAVEFALIAPVFFFLMFVIAETGLIFVAEQVMDNAVFDTARLIRTGQVQAGGMSEAQFKKAVCDRMSVFVDCGSGDFYLDVRAYPTFADMQFGRPLDEDDQFGDSGAFQFGQANDIIVVRAYYQWPTRPIMGGFSLADLSNNKRLIGAFAAFRNEPFAQTAEAR